jgi:hypothetical protein
MVKTLVAAAGDEEGAVLGSGDGTKLVVGAGEALTAPFSLLKKAPRTGIATAPTSTRIIRIRAENDTVKRDMKNPSFRS